MFAGEAVSADVMEYAASNMQLTTKDEDLFGNGSLWAFNLS